MDHRHRYTGEILPMWTAETKRQALMELAEEHNIDLSKSWSYGDTAADISMFELTGYPSLINPTRELIDLMRMDHKLLDRTTCIVERKDAIYRMNLKDVELIDDRTNNKI